MEGPKTSRDQSVDEATIAEFGEQWSRYKENTGYYGSVELLADLLDPFLSIEDLKASHVADIGSGTGRIVNMLLDGGVSSVIAVEPSEAFSVLKNNTADRSGQIRYIHGPGTNLPPENLDFVFSFGVLHHVLDPAPIVKSAFEALKPEGRMLVWLYGHEGNEIYLKIIIPMRHITTHIPDWILTLLSHILSGMLSLYIVLCRYFSLPLREYILQHFAKLDGRSRRLTVFDQLNPAYAKYYTREEATALLADAGFTDIHTFHRHGYSWTVIGQR